MLRILENEDELTCQMLGSRPRDQASALHFLGGRVSQAVQPKQSLASLLAWIGMGLGRKDGARMGGLVHCASVGPSISCLQVLSVRAFCVRVWGYARPMAQLDDWLRGQLARNMVSSLDVATAAGAALAAFPAGEGPQPLQRLLRGGGPPDT